MNQTTKVKKPYIKNIIKIFLFYLIIPFLIVLLLYPLLPTLLNYPPDSINNQFQIEFDGVTYTQQYLIIIILVFFFSFVMLMARMRTINNCLSTLIENTDLSTKKIELLIQKTRHYCLNTPYLLYYLEISIPLILMPLTFIIIQAYLLTIIKICLIYILFFTLGAVMSFVFSQREFKKILIFLHTMYPEISNKVENEKNEKKSKSIAIKLFLQLIPLIVVALFFTSLIGYTQAAKKTGDIYYSSYKNLFDQTFSSTNYKSEEQLEQQLNSILFLDPSHEYFILREDGTYLSENNTKLSPFFIKYTLEKSDSQNGRTYDYFCLDKEGFCKKLSNGTESVYVGIVYDTTQPRLFTFLLISDVILLLIVASTLIYISASLAKDIKTVTQNLEDITTTNDTIKFNHNLPITSEDEMRSLVIAFNNIQKMTKENVEKLQDNQEALMEKERLASLGQLIGGIAHNLKTPIMSIAGATEGISELIDEYNQSIGDSEVTIEDHHEIAHDMQEWINKIKNYTEYMSDVITAVKGQAVALSGDTDNSFTIEELIKHINILMKHELNNALVTLNVSMLVDPDLEIHGNINSLVQVINNILSNAIQAYSGKPNMDIDVTLQKENNHLIIAIKDYASGIPKDIKEKLFKEMVTTKGKNGTGLGLFMSYSNIRAHFNGTMSVESEEGKGTIFYITIPLD